MSPARLLLLFTGSIFCCGVFTLTHNTTVLLFVSTALFEKLQELNFIPAQEVTPIQVTGNFSDGGAKTELESG